jgi:predicted transcriptional regulator
LKDFNQPEHPPSNPPNRSILPSTSTNTYDLTKILNKKKSKTTVTIPELHSKIKTLKSELQTLKQAQQKDSVMLQYLLSKIKSQSDTKSETEDQTIESHALPHTLTNIEHIPDDFLNVLTEISFKKYLIRIMLIFSEDFKLDTIVLFDTGADLNCIK